MENSDDTDSDFYMFLDGDGLSDSCKVVYGVGNEGVGPLKSVPPAGADFDAKIIAIVDKEYT